MKKGLLVLICGTFGLAGQAFAALTGGGAVPPITEAMGLLCLGLLLIGTAGVLRSRQKKMQLEVQRVQERPVTARPQRPPA